MDERTSKVYEILARKSGTPIDAIRAETRLEALGIDSLDMTEILFEIEEAFDIQIPDSAEANERFKDYATAGGVADLVGGLLAAKSA